MIWVVLRNSMGDIMGGIMDGMGVILWDGMGVLLKDSMGVVLIYGMGGV